MSWSCPKCERELPRKDYRHYCQRVDLDSLFQGRSRELVLAFDKIMAEAGESDRKDSKANGDELKGELRDFLEVHNPHLKNTDNGEKIIQDKIGGRSTYYTESQELFT
ncbi:hypothetical protein ACFQZS_03260 [Mucilaginibacter calamicampi]|uniref:Uncharacterized protein n=1 Tax=Mucilaginibacter calamicampi TaxID=1302352 RepID=A0ABW2YRU4_9SPHI